MFIIIVIRTDKFSDMTSYLKGFNSAILKLQLKPQLEANNEDYYILSYFTSSERLMCPVQVLGRHFTDSQTFRVGKP